MPSLRESIRRDLPTTLALVAAVALTAPVRGADAVAAAPERAEKRLTTRELQEIEATTESFARHLIDLAHALETPGEGVPARFFDERVESTPLAGLEPGPPRRVHPWIERRNWTVPRTTETVPGKRLAAELARFFAPFPSVESVALEVTGSSVPSSDTVEAEADLAVVARNSDGHKEWLRGHVRVNGRREDGDAPWKIGTFVIETLDSLVAPRDLFHEVSALAGVTASDPPLAESLPKLTFWQPHGAAAQDVDGDGLLDLFVTGPDGNHLYLNQGDGTFRDGAAAAGLKVLAPDRPELVPAFLDFDNDGDSDLFVTSFRSNLVLENRLVPDGLLSFRDVSARLPQEPRCQGWSVAVGDVNGDGRPDVYVTCYGSPIDGPLAVTTVDDTAGRPNLLYLNQGDGSFTEVAAQWGVADSRFGMAAQFADIDGDADLDLFVANDFGGGNSLFINEGDHFVDQTRERGLDQPAESMGVSFADYDNDGDLDLHVTNMSSKAALRALSRFPDGEHPMGKRLKRIWSGNTLYENLGDGHFRDVSQAVGPFPGRWAWGGGFLDIDNDGWEDLHTPNGQLSGSAPYDTESLLFSTIIGATLHQDRETVEAIINSAVEKQGELIGGAGYSFSGHQRDLVLLNLEGQGSDHYLDVSGVSGADAEGDGWASVYADFDNDGDYDVFLRGTHGQAHLLFHNRLGQENRSLRVALEGRESGRDAFGALVRVTRRQGGTTQTLTKVKHGSNGYLAQSDPRLLFGLGADGEATAVEVRWPSGKVQHFSGPFASDSLRIVEGEERPKPVEERRFRLPDLEP